jgi:hypothetical protein
MNWIEQYKQRISDQISAMAARISERYSQIAMSGALGMDAQRFDAGETGVLSLQLEELMMRAFEVDHAPTLAMQIIPTDDTISYAESIAYEQITHVGAAKSVSNQGEDTPLVNTFSQRFIHQVDGYSVGYEISLRDLKNAQLSGTPIEMRKQNAAQMAINQALDDLATEGSNATNSEGFLNNSSLTPVTPITGTWSAATGLQMQKDIAHLLATVRTQSLQNHTANTLVVDPDSFDYMDTIIANTAKSVKEWVEGRGIRLFDWHKCSLADAAGTGPRIVAFEANLNNVFFRLTNPFELVGPQERDLKLRVIASAYSAGTMFPKPLSMAYMDGI